MLALMSVRFWLSRVRVQGWKILAQRGKEPPDGAAYDYIENSVNTFSLSSAARLGNNNNNTQLSLEFHANLSVACSSRCP
jgi:lipopolysaccharide export system protein LptC